MDNIPQTPQPEVITAKAPFPKKPLIIFTVILSLFVTLLILNSFNLLPAFSFLSSGPPPQNQSLPVSKPSPSPTPLNISLSCPVPKEFCQKVKVLNEGNNFNGLGFTLPVGTPLLAAFSAKLSDQPKNPKADPKKPVLYLRDSQGNEVIYSFVGTTSAKLESEVSKGQEIGKIGQGTLLSIPPFTGLNLFFGLRQEGKYRTISPQNFEQ